MRASVSYFERLVKIADSCAVTYIPKHFADWREVPSQALERRELRDALTKALESLPEKYREILRTRLSRARPQVALA